MDIFEEIVEYKKNVKEAVNLFAILSTMSTQMNEAFDKLMPIMLKISTPPLASQKDREDYKKDLEIVLAGLKMQRSIVATSGPAYCQTAMELNKLLKELEVEE